MQDIVATLILALIYFSFADYGHNLFYISSATLSYNIRNLWQTLCSKNPPQFSAFAYVNLCQVLSEMKGFTCTLKKRQTDPKPQARSLCISHSLELSSRAAK